ncbi:DNA-binding transcriptional regulator, LysR family [Actinokineospora alba]|uniref:DNA-binding transcriptional regulator, LysR family n=1 Tax=Actinokineospora alba TaxID=504798 RepID=A0A1H0Q7Y8_9PSEU|nr:LysR family transcriptional regulator [Actinokineospora alba]TDP66096.1 DNA-binding transcriptional LysR family regulator [Actinokineospora alba]SDI58243.1 DNA-binding transcriptional regulator, LysR family [Actinokineospora alba]SDP12806.1 DNA-binding transcriptional regulator, LysR family [Actinokineospora alba]
MIDPRRLRVLRALADHGTVTAAGQALHLTPSAVSQQLAALESEVGQDLLHRKGRRVWLTAAGELLVEHATAVIAELDRAEARLAAYAAGETGRVRVAAFASAITQVVAPAIVALRASAPGVSVVVHDAERSLPMLLDGEIDIAVTVEYWASAGDDDQRVVRTPLYAEPFDAVLPPGHRLTDQAEVNLSDLATDDWVAPLPGNPCRDVLVVACEGVGFTPRITHTSDDFHAEAALVAAGGGVALIPRTALAGVEPARVRPIAVDPPTRRVFAAVRRGRENHPLIVAVQSALRKAVTHSC